MTDGILERIEAKLDRLLAGGISAAAGVTQPPPPVDPAAAERARLEAQLAALNGGGTATQATTTQAAVTSDQLMALITPHLDNAAIKEALGAEMRAAGINALPEAQPHQYADLYARFQRVIAANPAVSTGNASII